METGPKTPAPRYIELGDVTSTSTEAMRLASAGERGPLWIRADRQTGGRGRSGRPWSSPEGNLAASFLFEPACPITCVHQLALLAGVAAHDMLTEVRKGIVGVGSTASVQLKWPNDILVHRAKLGGILTESTTFDGALVVVIGIGINVRSAPSEVGCATTCLTDHGTPVPTARQLLPVLASAVDTWLSLWDRGNGFDLVRAAWLQRAFPVGHAMTVRSGAGPVTGVFAGLDPAGALLLTDAIGQSRRFSYGDVTLEPAKEQEP